MTWRDQLREASFRGVPFLWEDADGEIGRRLATHEYPGRASAYHEDLGRKPRMLSIRAWIVGADYMAGRDAMLEAIEEPGPATLVHPYLGAIRAVCISARLRETTRDGGMAFFDLQFAEHEENRFPRTAEDTAATVQTDAGAAMAGVETDFKNTFKTAGQPSWVGDQAQNLLGGALDDIGGATGGLSGDAAKSAALSKDLAAAKANLTALAADPSELSGAVIGLISGAAGLSAGGRGLLVALALLDGFGADLDPQPETTAARRVAGRNQTALVALVRRAAAIEAARAAAGLEFDSFDDAAATRDTLSARLDGLMIEAGDLGDDAAWAAMTKLRAAMVRDLNARGARLPRLVAVTPARTLPSLALAQTLFGDDPDGLLDRAGEIVAQNRVRHPLFIAGGEPLSVLALEAANG